MATVHVTWSCFSSEATHNPHVIVPQGSSCLSLTTLSLIVVWERSNDALARLSAFRLGPMDDRGLRDACHFCSNIDLSVFLQQTFEHGQLSFTIAISRHFRRQSTFFSDETRSPQLQPYCSLGDPCHDSTVNSRSAAAPTISSAAPQLQPPA